MSQSPNSRTPTQQTFLADDGATLSYRCWPPVDVGQEHERPTGVLLLCTCQDRSDSCVDWADAFAVPKAWFFALNPPRGRCDKATDVYRLVRDTEQFAQHIAQTHGVVSRDTAAFAHGHAALIALAWIHDFAPRPRGLVLVDPAVQPRLDKKSLKRDRPRRRVNGLHQIAKRLVDNAHTLTTPTLTLVTRDQAHAGRLPLDPLFERIATQRDGQAKHCDDSLDPPREAPHANAMRAARAFLMSRLADNASPAASSAELAAPAMQAFESLQKPLPRTSPSHAWWAGHKLALATVGRLSRSVQIGWREGFQSGTSLDHIYRNRAQGFTPLGKLIDRVILNASGMRALRQRKTYLERLIDDAVAKCLLRQNDVRLFDLAAGTGLCVLDTLQRHDGQPITALLGDLDETCLREGRRLAAGRHLQDRVGFTQVDAFDPDDLRAAAARFQPNLIVVSGLYELFPHNATIKRSLAGLRTTLPPGGQLLYTNVPWHPHYELITRIIPQNDAKPWVMRCRSQAEMDTLVEEHGFARRDLLIDADGIFSVARAERLAEPDVEP